MIKVSKCRGRWGLLLLILLCLPLATKFSELRAQSAPSNAAEALHVLWGQSKGQADLKSEPKDNADRILAYHNKGLLATRGHRWVCKGNLQTEYLPAETVRELLAK